MEEVVNNQLYKEVVETLLYIQQSIDDTKDYKCYLGSIKNEVFEIKDDETYSEAIKRGEGIFDRIDETERRRKIVIEKGQEIVNKIKTVADKISRIIKECKSDEETVNKVKNELIDKIISIEEMIMKEEINKIKTRFNKNKEEREKRYSDYLEMKMRKEDERKKQEQEERLQRMRGMSTPKYQIEQLEEWTERKVGNVLFDSDIDNWNRNTSVFDQRIMNKKHVTIIIKDSEGNKFGGYVNEKIDKYGYDWINDSKSFVFSLESNGRIKGMMKFDIKQPQFAFYLHNQSCDCLFGFGNGHDIRVCKENDKTKSWCEQCSFEYKGISNTLCGKLYPDRFTPKRIIVIEMK
ncbi:predicted protein [Entamoeba histolytica]